MIKRKVWAKSSLLITGSNLNSPQKAAHVLSRFTEYVLLCPYHQECVSNYAFFFFFPASTTQRDPKKNLLEKRKEKKTPIGNMDWRPAACVSLYHRCVVVCVCVLNACSWKEMMSAIQTWACFLLWISFATQDKTPGKTQTPLCPAATTDPSAGKLSRGLRDWKVSFLNVIHRSSLWGKYKKKKYEHLKAAREGNREGSNESNVSSKLNSDVRYELRMEIFSNHGQRKKKRKSSWTLKENCLVWPFLAAEITCYSLTLSLPSGDAHKTTVLPNQMSNLLGNDTESEITRHVQHVWCVKKVKP